MGRLHDAERYFLSQCRDPLAARRLGNLYMEMEEYEKARRSYDAFLTAYKDPDPSLQPIVAQSRQNLTSVSPVRRG